MTYQNSKMISGVVVKQLKVHCDDRGFLAEILKEGEEVFRDIKQVTYTETHPGVIKAFHWHKKQWDAWFVASGMAQVVLHDLREGSSTHRETNVFYIGEKNPQVILIPPGVAHGYRVLGNEPVRLIYFTTEIYNPNEPDEERIPFDSQEIGFDWATRNR